MATNGVDVLIDNEDRIVVLRNSFLGESALQLGLMELKNKHIKEVAELDYVLDSSSTNKSDLYAKRDRHKKIIERIEGYENKLGI